MKMDKRSMNYSLREQGIPNFDGDRLDVLALNKEDKNNFAKTLADIEDDRKSKLESFKTRIAAEMGPMLEDLYKDILKDEVNSTVTIPVQNVYKVTCSVGLDVDFILIRATSETDAWNKFWEHYKDEPNLSHEDFGSKEDYEYTRGYWKKKGGIVSITIETINSTSDFQYIGGGRADCVLGIMKFWVNL